MASTAVNEALLDERLAQVEQARAWSPRVISRLETFIRTADDYDLFRINPLHYSRDRGTAETEGIDLFLYTTRYGLFEMQWSLVCPICTTVVDSFRDLSHVHPHFVCIVCEGQSLATLDDHILVTFTVSAEIRPIAFHRPETLSIDDYLFRYRFMKGFLLLPNGMTYEEIFRRHIKHLSWLAPGASANAEFEATPGALYLRHLGNGTGATFYVNDATTPQAQQLAFEIVDGNMRPVGPSLPPADVQTPVGLFKFQQHGELTGGTVTIHLDNRLDKACPLCIFLVPLPPPEWEFEPFLSGKRLLTTQTFRELFRSQTVASNEALAVNNLTFLFTDLHGSTALYDLIGDTQAFHLVQQHFDALARPVTRHAGAIVKTIGDSIMATFETPVQAVQAAVDMVLELQELNHRISEKLSLKIGIHSGHSIAVTLNDRLDYFGQTVNIASRVQGLAGGGEIYLSQDVYEYPGVADILARYETVPEQTVVKGVSGTLQVYKVVPT